MIFREQKNLSNIDVQGNQFYTLATSRFNSNSKRHKMINRELTDPKSIVVIGGSNDLQKPGGKILKNIIDGGYKGTLIVLNPKEDKVQGLSSYREYGIIAAG